MGRVRVQLDDSREIIAGYDGPFNTWFAQLYEGDFSREADDDSPAKTLGYTSHERALSHPATQHGPYPIRSLAELLRHMKELWDIELTDEQRRAVLGDRARFE